MMAEITGMFGPSPYEIEQQRLAQVDQSAFDFSKMNATQRGVMGLYKAGGMLGGLGARATGGVDPAVQRAQMTHEAAQGVDTSTPEGLLQFADKIKQYDPNKAAQAVMMARKMQAEAAAQKLAQQKEDRAQQKLEEVDKQRMQNDFDLKKAKLEQDYEIAKMRSEDSRLSSADRLAASREATAARLQLGMLMAEVKKIGLESKQGGLAGKPKNLTREAALKWELDNGLIDQATYDAAISASPGGLLRKKQNEALETSETGFSSVERNIEQLFDPASKKLKPSAQPLFGKYAQYRPEVSMSQDTVDAKLALEGLTDQVMMANLADAKARVGQSFGSMQVQEWDKFTQQLTSLKRGLSEEQAAKSMEYVLDFIKNKRAVLTKALNTDNPIYTERGNPVSTETPSTKTFSGVTTPAQVKQLLQSKVISREQAKAILMEMESRGIKVE